MDSRFYCVHCGKEGIPIIRKNSKFKKAGHLKKLWCLNCQKETNHAEVKEFTHYDKECFDLEFNYGNFDKDGNRIMPFGLFKDKMYKEGVILKWVKSNYG